MRKWSTLPIHLLIGCSVLIGSLAGRSLAQSASAQTPKQQLRAAVAVVTNREAELQRVETAFAGSEEAALARLLRGYLRLQAKDYANASVLLGQPQLGEQSGLGDYVLYFRAQSQQESGAAAGAEQTYRLLAKTQPTSLLARTASLQAAGAAFLRGDYALTLQDVATLAQQHDATALKLRADALQKLGRTGEAVAALRQIYFEAPHAPEAGAVAAQIAALGGTTVATNGNLLRTRADKLFANGLYLLAAQAYEQLAQQFPALLPTAWLKAGTSYYKGNNFAQAIIALSQARNNPATREDALYYTGLAQVAQRADAQVLTTLAELQRVAPQSERAGEILLALGRSYQKRNLEMQAIAIYEQALRQFPLAPNADDAHFWLAWRAHEARDYAAAAHRLKEHLALYGKQADNRGRAAFWAAVDAERIGQRAQALTLYRALQRRYGAGWYGVNAERRAGMLQQAGVRPVDPTQDALLAKAVAGLQDITQAPETIGAAEEERLAKAEKLVQIALQQSALNELEAARERAPKSPLVNLRIAQIYRARNENVTAINMLKRAYPDYGQTLPNEMPRAAWDIFYPLNYWPMIKEQAKLHGLDPYFVAGLIRQETVFNASARSHANAYGLMQILPSTGRMVAKRYSVGGGNVAPVDLLNPMISIQLGTAYLEQLRNEFGRMEYVAAAYNGGPGRVARWTRELPTVEIEEWVESIPISETRLYVSGVYRNMRQYQRLYDEQGNFRQNIPQ